MNVTAVERKRRRASVYVDGELAIEIGTKLAAEQGVVEGASITTAKLAELKQLDAKRQTMDAAVRLLSYRQRGIHELRERLRRKGFEPDVIQVTVARLKELGYLDDEAFAQAWTATRRLASPRAARLLASELRLKGIAPDVANAATAEISDEEAAYKAASHRVGALRKLDYRKFRERLGRFLTSRGFSYGISKGIIDRCWAESGGEERDEESE